MCRIPHGVYPTQGICATVGRPDCTAHTHHTARTDQKIARFARCSFGIVADLRSRGGGCFKPQKGKQKTKKAGVFFLSYMLVRSHWARTKEHT